MHRAVLLLPTLLATTLAACGGRDQVGSHTSTDSAYATFCAENPSACSPSEPGSTSAADAPERSARPVRRRVPRVAAGRRCASAELAIANGPLVSPETGEHAILVRIRNVGRRTCELAGYPRVALYAGARRLSFAVGHGGGYGADSAPRRVALRPQGHAYVLVAKYRCDDGGIAVASELRLRLPGTERPLRLALHPVDGGSELVYCGRLGALRTNPGNRLNVSPVRRRAF